MAISMRLNTRRRTAVATTARLPRYARNDKVRTRKAHPDLVEGRSTLAAGILPSPAGSEGELKPLRHHVGAWQSLCSNRRYASRVYNLTTIHWERHLCR